MKRYSSPLLRRAAAIGGLLLLGGLFGGACGYVYVAPSLPSAEAMRNVEFQVPLRVYTRSGGLVSQIGEQRRVPVTFDDIPERVRQAVLAAEDDRFFEHSGIDWAGVLRAVVVNLVSADRAQGASTITMQAARNSFLTLDKTWRRKLQEVYVTLRMESELSKEEILATYLNVIFFGQRSYGVAAAAETYFGKALADLDVAEAATLAGIIQVPSRYNPIANPDMARTRRAYVLRRMVQLGHIDEEQAKAANAAPMVSRNHAPRVDVEAPYVAELARLEVVRRFGPAAVNHGYKVYTTVDGRLQAAANRALRVGLVQYDRRRGYRGPLAQIALAADAGRPEFEAALDGHDPVGMLQPAVVTAVAERTVTVHVAGLGPARIDWTGLSWARRVRNGMAGANPKRAADVAARGDIVLVVVDDAGNAQLAQVPEAQAALVALDPEDGAIVSMVGGFDYYTKQFNRVTQARRQPGSGFKPFLYSAALDHGLTPASIILDTPIVVDDPSSEGGWRPENSGGEFGGPTRLREALVQSRNLVSIRILRDMGPGPVIEHASRFGFEPANLPRNLTLALGTLPATPLDMATGFATFANGGYKVAPYLIDRIVSPTGEVLYEAAPQVVCRSCEETRPADTASTDDEAGEAAEAGTGPAQVEEAAAQGETPLLQLPPAPRWPSPELAAARVAGAPPALQALSAVQGGNGYLPAGRIAPRVISAQNAWLMTDFMSDVIRRGTGRRALALGRNDLAGKTGTTNDARDTWFNGFNADLVATVWVGYDEERPLGEGEEGARTAVPIWVNFMREALRQVPDHRHARPPGLIDLPVSASTGQWSPQEGGDTLVETFMVTQLPPGARFVPSEAASDSGSAPTLQLQQQAPPASGGEPLF